MPDWLVKTTAGVLIAAAVGGATAWGSRLSAQASNHETRITVTEKQQISLDARLQRIEDKLDRVLERRSP